MTTPTSLTNFGQPSKKLFSTKSTSEPGAAFCINGTETTDKSFIANRRAFAAVFLMSQGC